ncbi:MAG: hypothetical protein ACD_52C00031G0003 [uncultured bacterium]|nr:MAG: hypothetical protein ACD_52C00031G0003 [uncultured bacterium]
MSAEIQIDDRVKKDYRYLGVAVVSDNRATFAYCTLAIEAIATGSGCDFNFVSTLP